MLSCWCSMAARSRWDQLGPRTEAARSIVSAMFKLCPRSRTWSETSDWSSNSLWGRLAERLLGVNKRRDRTWLRIIFTNNRNRVQVKVFEIYSLNKIPCNFVMKTLETMSRNLISCRHSSAAAPVKKEFQYL